MKARWVLHYPAPELPGIGMAIVASWWPGRFYKVSTVQLDSAAPIAELTRSLEQHVPFGQATPAPAKYITQVLKCTKDGTVQSFFEPFTRESIRKSQRHKSVINRLLTYSSRENYNLAELWSLRIRTMMR